MHKMFDVDGVVFWVDFNEENKEMRVTGPRANTFDSYPVSPAVTADTFMEAEATARKMAGDWVRGRLRWR